MHLLSFLFLPTLFAAEHGQKNPSAGTRKPGPVECGACVLLVDKIVDLSKNQTAISQVIEVLDKGCDKITPKNSTLDKICQEVAASAVKLLPQIDKQIDSLAWENKAICAALDACTVPCCLTEKEPEQVHLALGDDPSRMAVMWTTGQSTAEQAVWWGDSATNLSFVSTDGSNTTYTEFGWRGVLHAATMTSLQPGRTYFYRVGSPSALSPLFSFRTLALGAGKATPLRVAVIGDMAYDNNSDATVRQLTALATAGELDLVLHNGDISYADGDMHHWDVFLRKIQPIASQVPYMTSPGNHEFWFNFTAYKKRFRMPNANETRNMFYSVDFGSAVHLSVLSTESDIDVAYMSPFERHWVEADLASASAQAAEWRIAAGHRPLYCSNSGGNDIPQGNHYLSRVLEDSLIQHRVDLVLQAHVHDYERTYPVAHDKPTALNYSSPTSPVYIVNGGAGNRELNDHPPVNRPWNPPPANGLTPYAHDVSYGLMHVSNKQLTWSQYRSSNNSLIDRFVITHA